MNKISWWNWEEPVIKERIHDFYNLDVNDFVAKYSELPDIKE